MRCQGRLFGLIVVGLCATAVDADDFPNEPVGLPVARVPGRKANPFSPAYHEYHMSRQVRLPTEAVVIPIGTPTQTSVSRIPVVRVQNTRQASTLDPFPGDVREGEVIVFDEQGKVIERYVPAFSDGTGGKSIPVARPGVQGATVAGKGALPTANAITRSPVRNMAGEISAVPVSNAIEAPATGVANPAGKTSAIWEKKAPRDLSSNPAARHDATKAANQATSTSRGFPINDGTLPFVDQPTTLPNPGKSQSVSEAVLRKYQRR